MINFYLNHPGRAPLITGVTAIENVVATKGFGLAQPFAIHLSWIEYHSIDAILLILVPFILIGVIIVKLCFRKKERVVKSKVQ